MKLQMDWHWDERKARANLQKHGISFDTAILVFDDPHNMTVLNAFPHGDRWETYGLVDPLTLVVIHTLYDDDSGGRIISARKATTKERRFYEEEI